MQELLNEKTSLWEHLKTATKPIYLYGVGDGALKIMNVLNKFNINIKGIFASNNCKKRKDFCGHKVLRYDDVKALHGNNFIALLAFASYFDDVMGEFYQMQNECEFYAPDVPVVVTDDEVFDLEYIKRHNNEFLQVYNMLEDKFSKKVFIDTLNFKVSGKIDYLKPITSDIDEVYHNIIKPTQSEVYIDLGAFSGDTVSELLRFSGGNAEKIIALEPDFKNFNKLKNRVEQENIKNITCYNIASWDKKESLTFQAKGGRNSKLANAGGIKIQANSVDNILKGERATIIKLDVEGAEYKSLLGSRNTIHNYKPKLMVSSYHKNEDLFALPLLIKSLNPNYKFYLRHHPYIPAWETNFYCI